MKPYNQTIPIALAALALLVAIVAILNRPIQIRIVHALEMPIKKVVQK